MKSVAYILFVFFLVSCNAIRVNYDYDKETDFSSYTTYNYYPEMETGMSEFDTKRLLDAIDATIQTKGIIFSEEPDFFINIKSKSFRVPQNNTVGVGLGGGNGSVGGGVSIGIPVGQPPMEREIQFDFVDSQKKVLFWQAISESTFKEDSTPEIKEQKLQQIVEKIFEKYPPKK